jgi:hypothetical protein
MSTLNTLTIRQFSSIPMAGETVRMGEWPYGVLRSIAGLTVMHRRVVNIVGNAAPQVTTLWDSSADTPSAFEYALIVADPDNERTADQLIDLRITNNGVASVWRFSRNVPYQLGPSAQTTGSITLIEALNLASTEPTTDDVKVAITVLNDG